MRMIGATSCVRLTSVCCKDHGGPVLAKKAILSKDTTEHYLFCHLVKPTEHVIEDSYRLP